MNTRQRKSLDAIMGEGAADKLEAIGEEKTKALEMANIAFKKVEDKSEKPVAQQRTLADIIAGRDAKKTISPVPWVGDGEHASAQKLSREPEPTSAGEYEALQRLLTDVHNLGRDVLSLTQTVDNLQGQLDTIRRNRVDQQIEAFAENVPAASQKEWLMRALESAKDAQTADDTKNNDQRVSNNPAMSMLFDAGNFQPGPAGYQTNVVYPQGWNNKQMEDSAQAEAHYMRERRVKEALG